MRMRMHTRVWNGRGEMAELKAAASGVINDYSAELGRLSDEIWQNPELAFKEHKAHALLSSFLEKNGFSVKRKFMGLDTAFRATFGSGNPNVCVICEYDALPDIGHACGHNLIAEAGIAAGMGVKAALESRSAPTGTLTVMGTPAEESGSGKTVLFNKGAFENVDVAMMIHPAPVTIIAPGFLACCSLQVTYSGKAAHAAAYPWEGLNALDAAVTAYNSISVLRQQMKPEWRVHGVITNGGAKPNIIPEKSVLEYYIRAPRVEDLVVLKKKVEACFEAAAKATGCEVSVTTDGIDLEINSNPTLCQLFADNAVAMGVENFDQERTLTASSDMGTLSYVLPSIHPMYGIGSGTKLNHTHEFTAIANTADAHSETLKFAKVMAHTCIDVLTQPAKLKAARKDFEASIAKLKFDPLSVIQGKEL